MSAPLVAAVSAMLAVWGAWEALGAIEGTAVLRRAGDVLAPLRRPGREPTAPERRQLAVLGAGALLAAGWLLAGPVQGLVAAAAGPWLVARGLAWRRRRWRAELARGASTVARAMADALAGGHGIRGALTEAARGGGVPGAAGRELEETARRLTLGERTDDVLERLRRRAASPPWEALVAAVLLQRDAGGDLAGLLRSLAAAQEQARRVEGEARGLTAQARATARIVAVLPLAGVVLGEVLQPGTIGGLLADPRSRWLLAGGVTLGALAFTVIARLLREGPA